MGLSYSYKSISTLAWFWSTRMGTIPNTAAPVSRALYIGVQQNGGWWTMES